MLLKLFKLFLLISQMFLCLEVFALKVTASGPTVYAGNSSSSTRIIVTEGTGSSSGSPVKVYVPVAEDSTTWNYSIYDSPSTLPSVGATPAIYLKVNLNLDNSSTSETSYLYGIVKQADSSYELFRGPLLSVVGNNNAVYSVLINVTESNGLWSTAGSDLGDGNTTIDEDVYFFLSSDSGLNDTEPTPSKYEGGVYYKFYFSDRVDDEGDYLIELITLAKGDSRLYAKVDSKDVPYYYKTIAINFATFTNHSGENFVTANGTILALQYDAEGAEEIKIRGLKNGRTYNLSLAQIDKFKYASQLSRTESQTPESIEALLEKQACYLLSAGFKKEHYVVNYFRDIRDNFLLKNIWGRYFVGWYYKNAPYYAKFVYRSILLSKLVVTSAYVVYYCLKYYLAVLLMALLIVTFAFFRKNKATI